MPLPTAILADDHEIVRRGLAALLTNEKLCTVIAEASDGLSAVKLVEKHRPQVLFLDLNLPKMTGLEVLETVRATPSLRTAPVVVLSTSRRQEDVEQMYAAGANTYIEKPPDFVRFVEALRVIHRYWLVLAQLPNTRE